MKLCELAVGAGATVKAVGGQGALRHRLLEMGLTPGTRVSVIRRAPLGDPIELRLRGYTLSLRAEEAAHIEIVSDREGRRAQWA